MLQWILANAGNGIVLAVLLAMVGGILAVLRRDRKRGGCCGGCSGCALEGACHKRNG